MPLPPYLFAQFCPTSFTASRFIALGGILALSAACSGEDETGSPGMNSSRGKAEGRDASGGQTGESIPASGAGGASSGSSSASGGSHHAAGGAAAGGSMISSGGGPSGSGGGAQQPDPECLLMVDSALNFLTALSEEHAQQARFTWDAPERQTFEFLPPGNAERKGLSLKLLSHEDRARFEAFLRSILSEKGALKVEAIMALEELLGEPPYRDPDNYFISIFGDPQAASEAPWGFRFEGHHLSLHGSVVACQTYAATPAFWGASPELSPLQAELDAARDLYQLLDASQKSIARSGSTSDTATMAKSTPATPYENAGLEAAQMTTGQKEQLRSLIGIWLGNMARPIAEDRWEALELSGFDQIRFSINGDDYRVQGPTFIIEMNSAGTDHVHGIWRDFQGDWGEDLLARHLAEHH